MLDFLPSEVARLVFGYLTDVGCENVAGLFLKTCSHLSECRQVCGSGRSFSTKVNGLTLTGILEKFSSIYSLIESYADDSNNPKIYDDLITILNSKSRINRIPIFNNNMIQVSSSKLTSFKFEYTQEERKNEISYPESVASSDLEDEFEPVDESQLENDDNLEFDNKIKFSEVLYNDKAVLSRSNKLEQINEPSSTYNDLLAAKPNETILSLSSEYINEAEPLEINLSRYPTKSSDEYAFAEDDNDNLKEFDKDEHITDDLRSDFESGNIFKDKTFLKLIKTPTDSPSNSQLDEEVSVSEDFEEVNVKDVEDFGKIDDLAGDVDQEVNEKIDEEVIQNVDEHLEVEDEKMDGDLVNNNSEQLEDEGINVNEDINEDSETEDGNEDKLDKEENPSISEYLATKVGLEEEKIDEEIDRNISKDLIVEDGQEEKLEKELLDQNVSNDLEVADTENVKMDLDNSDDLVFEVEQEKEIDEEKNQSVSNDLSSKVDEDNIDKEVTIQNSLEDLPNEIDQQKKIDDETINLVDNPKESVEIDQAMDVEVVNWKNPDDLAMEVDQQEKKTDEKIIDLTLETNQEKIDDMIDLTDSLKELSEMDNSVNLPIDEEKINLVDSSEKTMKEVKNCCRISVNTDLSKKSTDIKTNGKESTKHEYINYSSSISNQSSINNHGESFVEILQVFEFDNRNNSDDKDVNIKIPDASNKNNLLEIEKPKEQNDKFFVVDSLDIPIESTVEIDDCFNNSKENKGIPLEEGIIVDDILTEKLELSDDLPLDSDRKKWPIRRAKNFGEKQFQNCKTIVEKNNSNRPRKSKRLNLDKKTSKLSGNNEETSLSCKVNSLEICCVYDKKTAKKIDKSNPTHQQIEIEHAIIIAKDDVSIPMEGSLVLRSTPSIELFNMEPREPPPKRKYNLKKLQKPHFVPLMIQKKRTSTEALENCKENFKETRSDIKRKRLSNTSLDSVRNSMISKFPIVLLERLDINKYNKVT